MDQKVTVLTPNGRRYNIKVTPNTTLLQILEEACQKGGFNSDEYNLTHHNKVVGLTQIFRFSGLPNNCLLEMTQAERKRVTTAVDICVQLEDGSRAEGRFQPSDNLWHVLESLSREATVNYSSPVAIYMRQDIVGRANLEKTTLKSLGVTAGRAMIRFIDKNPTELKTQASVYMRPAAKPAEEEAGKDAARKSPKPNRASESKSGGFAITKDIIKSLKKSPEEPQPSTSKAAAEATQREPSPEKPKYDWGSGAGHRMDNAGNTQTNAANSGPTNRSDFENESIPEPEVNVIGERNAVLYSLDTARTELQDLPDSFFELTVHDLKLVLRDLKKIAAGSEDAPLLTEELRKLEEEKAKLRKISQYRNSVIRIQFPDRHVLQAIFSPGDKISNVMDFARKFMANPKMKFYLFTIPPKTVLPAQKTLLELDFVPTALVHLALEDEKSSSAGTKSLLKAEYLQKLTSAEGALFLANKLRVGGRRMSADNKASVYYDNEQPGTSSGAIPKRSRSEV